MEEMGDTLVIARNRQVAPQASMSFNEMDLPDAIEIDPLSFEILGPKLGAQAALRFDALENEYGPRLPALVAKCVKMAWLCVHLDIEWEKNGWNTKRRVPTDPYDYVNTLDWEFTFESIFGSISHLPDYIREGFSALEGFETARILELLSTYFYSCAASELKIGNVEKGLNWIHEATEALVSAEYMTFRTWYEQNHSEGDLKVAASRLSSLGGHARNAENRAIKAEVFQWCDVNLGQFPSIDSAAEAIAMKVFPIKFRTAHSHITAWRRSQDLGV